MDLIDLNKVTLILKLQQVALNSLLCAKLFRKLRKKLRRWWVKPHLLPEIQNAVGAYEVVCLYFQMTDHEEFQHQFKMTADNFENLHRLVGHDLEKQYRTREPIPSIVRLALTLHYLGHGGSVMFYRVGRSTYYNIVAETCKVITRILMPLYIQLPNQEGWLRIAQDFEEKWNFPNCIGPLDGRHMRIKKPPRGGSVFFNYKRYHSIVLLAICDAHGKFVWFTVGDGGSFSDTSVLNISSFYKKLINNELQIPAAAQLSNSDRLSPFVFVADEIFGLNTNVMKPYNRRFLRGVNERIFNYRLSRARFTIECSFGILCSKFQLFNSPLNFNLTTTRYVISCCLCLHNFSIINNRENVQNNNRNIICGELQNVNNVVGNPVTIRHNLTEYFANEGAVPWQNEYL